MCLLCSYSVLFTCGANSDEKNTCTGSLLYLSFNILAVSKHRLQPMLKRKIRNMVSNPPNTRRSLKIGSMLGQLRANNELTFGQCLVFAGNPKHTVGPYTDYLNTSIAPLISQTTTNTETKNTWNCSWKYLICADPIQCICPINYLKRTNDFALSKPLFCAFHMILCALIKYFQLQVIFLKHILKCHKYNFDLWGFHSSQHTVWN